MSLFSPNPTRLEHCCPQAVPGWVAQHFDPQDPVASGLPGMTVSDDGNWSLARALIGDADALDDDALRRQTCKVYRALLDQLKQSSAPFPVRGWNAIPAIGRVQQRGYDRYMAFNAGRHEAYRTFFKDTRAFADQLPTASAIGHDGQALAISLLGHRQPGRAIENPRQVPAFRYSARFGPVPPSFVRATVLPPDVGPNRILVAGTASVVGEDSRHTGDLEQQVQETYRNLATVLLAVDGRGDAPGPMPADALGDTLQRYRSVRVYVRRPGDQDAVCASVRATMTGLNELEIVPADICRPELLVEIEGVAAMPNGVNG